MRLADTYVEKAETKIVQNKSLDAKVCLNNAHAHRFRYTFAIEFLRNGGNVFVLKELLGHEKLEQTMRYVKFVESDISESAKHSPTDNWRL